MLSPDVQAEILSKHFGQNLAVRAIARELGISRKAVSRVLAHRTVRLVPKRRAAPHSVLDPKTAIQEKHMPDVTDGILFLRAGTLKTALFGNL